MRAERDFAIERQLRQRGNRARERKMRAEKGFGKREADEGRGGIGPERARQMRAERKKGQREANEG